MNSLYKKSHKMPWTIYDAPHGLLDILRGCNCKCSACYNNAELKIKTFEEVKADFEVMLSVRNISSVGIIGGEPLLHPDLFKIIAFLKQKGLTVEILTNGVLLNEEMAEKLANSGVDLVFLHIDKGQKRPDLTFQALKQEVDNLRTEKAKLLFDKGIETAMSITIGKNELENNLTQYLDYFKNSPYINYFLLTLYKDISSYGYLKGSLTEGAEGDFNGQNDDEPKMEEVTILFKEKENMLPYWYMTGKYNKDYPRWVSYLYAAAYDKKGVLKCYQSMKYSKMEEKYLEKYKRKNGRYPFFKKQTRLMNFLFILFNAVMGGYFIRNILFLIKSFGKRRILKRIFVQEPAYINKDGKLEHCESCPDAAVKNGKVVPVCVCDCF